MSKLERYVGRSVRLNEHVFAQLTSRNRRPSDPPENFFLVAAISREMRKLICYGANLRVAVGIADVVLV